MVIHLMRIAKLIFFYVCTLPSFRSLFALLFQLFEVLCSVVPNHHTVFLVVIALHVFMLLCRFHQFYLLFYCVRLFLSCLRCRAFIYYLLRSCGGAHFFFLFLSALIVVAQYLLLILLLHLFAIKALCTPLHSGFPHRFFVSLGRGYFVPKRCEAIQGRFYLLIGTHSCIDKKIFFKKLLHGLLKRAEVFRKS